MATVYWMQRSQRAHDNLALKFTIDLANDLHKPVLVYFGLYDEYPMASARAFQFMLEGLKETARLLMGQRIGFLMRREHPARGLPKAAEEFNACAVVVDEDYLNIGRNWRDEAATLLAVRLYQLDAETIVPARTTDKEETGAYTLRPKIAKVLDKHFVEIPESEPLVKWKSDVGEHLDLANVDVSELVLSLKVDQQVPPTPHFVGGYGQAVSRLERFISDRLDKYATERNEIGVSASSDMSPYFHFGQISSLRAGLMVRDTDAPDDCVDAFLEQLIVRRELAINFCLYNPAYESIDAASDWAKATIDAHRWDSRPEVYSLEELEQARTHDELWNASQIELLKFGKIHPYMRLVWAKSILVWSPTPEEALARTLYLNDKYALDGRDPNGYTNIAWCIYGKHDRPFAERPIFGKIRPMTLDATRKKTNWRDYVERIRRL